MEADAVPDDEARIDDEINELVSKLQQAGSRKRKLQRKLAAADRAEAVWESHKKSVQQLAELSPQDAWERLLKGAGQVGARRALPAPRPPHRQRPRTRAAVARPRGRQRAAAACHAGAGRLLGAGCRRAAAGCVAARAASGPDQDGLRARPPAALRDALHVTAPRHYEPPRVDRPLNEAPASARRIGARTPPPHTPTVHAALAACPPARRMCTQRARPGGARQLSAAPPPACGCATRRSPTRDGAPARSGSPWPTADGRRGDG